ncbi:MAG: hypothetical protein ACXWXF_13400 [Aeromicrobium sp.]
MTDDLDPGAYIGHEPELAEETIPGGVGPGDERVSAYDSKPGVDGEPDDQRDSSDVVEGSIGGASLREPSEIEEQGVGADLDGLPGVETNTTR